MQALKERLVTQAISEGFVACRLCRPDAVPQVAERLAA
ncbi:MAG: epoxyqueuosine reductase, partial [Roseobacter sp.]|nr:epoxyqueuosine reductase [Roseobacter sp.]